MTGERAKRFPLGLEDLVREPRRPEGRPGEVRAAALAASAALNGRQQSAKSTQGGAAARAQVKAAGAASNAAAARPQVIPQAKVSGALTGAALSGTTGAAPSGATPPKPPKPQAAPVAKPTLNGAPNSALALTSERVRERMVERVRANGVSDQRVLNALAAVPRHLFVDPGLAAQAYEDAALPIGHHQTISKPSVVARMIELAAAGRALNTVLEIGTGCGYQAAVLSQVAREVYSIERIKPLSERAKTNLRPLRIPNIRLHYGDGRLGLPSAAPFDAIVIAAAGLDVPQALLEQLAIGGRLIAPVGSQDGQSQVLTLVERVGPAQWRESRLDRVFFVPLKSGVI
ncbi:protein-L-isoaspartate(D-aspartate) O-methyltransferase [Paraburkholderia sp. MMS20-SJTR3]|uniref:Protein-L-isoaspartate O-methyltransferase n=1 Tax=Paraburkholderia sejongensis TaxID=2886946 RepID=A0ABS8JN70_9BURK|nr:protein-L-isoaspartate(D-aspartate) O-methyltransferase [Paraburkholderia sp. MMS20-SJTR3]MCC8391336.1 protein-L-isoaspartate(D-aspartate) O-methyltransferase [Paraburkholderia sp. MMS20-SJTR3]